MARPPTDRPTTMLEGNRRHVEGITARACGRKEGEGKLAPFVIAVLIAKEAPNSSKLAGRSFVRRVWRERKEAHKQGLVSWEGVRRSLIYGAS